MAESAGSRLEQPGAWELGLAGRHIRGADADTEVLPSAPGTASPAVSPTCSPGPSVQTSTYGKGYRLQGDDQLFCLPGTEGLPGT